jgi:hypothetical protein
MTHRPVGSRLAHLLVRAHAPAWRQRYGPEFEALVRELPAETSVIADALGSALASRRFGSRVTAAAIAALLLVAASTHSLSEAEREARGSNLLRAATHGPTELCITYAQVGLLHPGRRCRFS